MKKLTDFTHSEQKNTYISGCKTVHKCTITTVTVHICTTTIACAFNILIISDSLLFRPQELGSKGKTNHRVV